QDPYAFLAAHLDTHASQTLEIEILPSAFSLPSTASCPFLSDGLSLGLPKRTLVEVFLTARRLLPSSNGTATERHHATRAILLFDPEHLTAANFRKRRLLDLRSYADGLGGHEELLRALVQELAFLSSLLTSPLNRHTKSPTLWYHRYWVLRTFAPHVINTNVRTDQEEVAGGSNVGNAGGVRSRWLSELAVVMRAGDRHPRNYYAWNYARRLFHFLISENSHEAATGPLLLTIDATAQVQQWCFRHPRDISGWSFLAFLLEQHFPRPAPSEEENENVIGLRANAVAETKEWARRFAWEGDSVKWFLRVMRMDLARRGRAQGSMNPKILEEHPVGEFRNPIKLYNRPNVLKLNLGAPVETHQPGHAKLDFGT
ncbi:MAG: hypothetical protein LQ347_002795, partial [Umbilicaria vellea]